VAATRPLLLAITDSIARVSDGNEPGKQYPTIIGQRFGWDTAIDAVSGRGFLEGQIGGVTIPSFDRGLPAVTAAHPDPDYVLIDGGRNDVGKPQDEAIAAMNEFYDAARSAYPNAKFIVTVPLRPSHEALVGDGSGNTYNRWAAEVHAAAARIDADVVDARAEHWYDGVDLAPYLWTDGIHLNAQGQEFYADKMIESMMKFADLGV
jgi:lysophospholipase L1-like esterase